MDKAKIDPVTSPIIFVAVYPRNNYLPAYLGDLEKSPYTILHPAYNWDTVEGQKALSKIYSTTDQKLSNSEDPYRRASDRDYFAIRHSDLVVFDVDSEPGFHFLTAAQVHGRKIIAVSNSLTSVPEYFTGPIRSVIRPDDLLEAIARYS